MVAPRGILWDMDGVIADSGHYHYLAYLEVLSALGVELPEKRYREQLFGRRNFLGDRPQPEIEALAGRKEAAFRRLVKGNVKPLPGADSLVRRAHALAKPQAIVSSTPRANIELVLKSLGLRSCFDAIVSEEDVTRGKPDPQGFALGAERLGMPPQACVVLEDAPEGIAAGKAAGMRCIGVATTRPPERLVQADLVVQTLEDRTVSEFLLDDN